MRRRGFIFLLGSAATWPLGVRAPQASTERPLLGWLGGSSPEAGQRNLQGFLQGLEELGHVPGKNVVIEYRWAGGDQSKQPTLAQELISLNPRVIIVANNPGVIAAAQATSTIPIVGALLSDPVRLGLAVRHKQPNKNVTGVLATVEGLPAKQVEVLREAAPACSRIAMLMNGHNPTHPMIFHQASASLGASSLTLVAREVLTVHDLDRSLRAMRKERIDGLVVLSDVFLFTHAMQIISLAEGAGIPAIHSFSEHVLRGGLMSYGVNVPENFRRAAYFVHRILGGTKPGDLPIELSTKIELAINLKTAKALGIEIPSTLLARADEVIE